MISADERIELPLFPLNAVLFPGGALPLKVFEQRYVEMTKRCVRDGTPFGVCLIREGREVGEPAVPATVGCTARIEQWDLPHPNLFHVLARGERRLRVLRSEVAALGLIMCEAQMLPLDTDPDAPDPLCRELLANLLERIGIEAFPGGARLDDASWVAYRLAEALPLPLSLRQQLLEIDSVHARSQMLREILTATGLGNST
jgi:Lon protease-like protein